MKFYVKSHDLQVVIAGPHIKNAKQAAIEAFLRNFKIGVSLSNLTIVSERGFDYMVHDYTQDKVFDTKDILIEAGFTFAKEDDNEC